jgi:hypothetical protein
MIESGMRRAGRIILDKIKKVFEVFETSERMWEEEIPCHAETTALMP